MSGDVEAAVDELIAKEPDNVRALIKKADFRAEAGDDKTANAFYRAALKTAARGNNSTASAGELTHAQQAVQRLAKRFEQYLEDSITAAGFGDKNRPERFQQALDIVLGRRAITMSLQRPRSFYFPGLPERRYYEREELAWAEELEQQTAAIRDELLPLVAEDEPFRPYLYSDPSRPPKHGLVDNPEWSSFTLWDSGTPIADNIDRCPLTSSVIQKADLLRLSDRAPHVMFSKLAAGARIEPHVGLLNMRLVCHLPLIVPEGCMFRVGGVDRKWHEGQLLVFDDSVLHEAWNNSDQDRVVLIFEIWRPEISQDERAAMTALFAAVDSY